MYVRHIFLHSLLSVPGWERELCGQIFFPMDPESKLIYCKEIWTFLIYFLTNNEAVSYYNAETASRLPIKEYIIDNRSIVHRGNINPIKTLFRLSKIIATSYFCHVCMPHFFSYALLSVFTVSRWEGVLERVSQSNWLHSRSACSLIQGFNSGS